MPRSIEVERDGCVARSLLFGFVDDYLSEEDTSSILRSLDNYCDPVALNQLEMELYQNNCNCQLCRGVGMETYTGLQTSDMEDLPHWSPMTPEYIQMDSWQNIPTVVNLATYNSDTDSNDSFVDTVSPVSSPGYNDSYSTNELPLTYAHHSVHSDAPCPLTRPTNIHQSDVTVSRRRRPRRQTQLWQFLLQTLQDPHYNPKYIEWVNKDQGIFRFVESRKVAQLWGDRKKRENMSYEYFSRAMRYYYARGIMQRVAGRRLVYQFLKNAVGWQQYVA